MPIPSFFEWRGHKKCLFKSYIGGVPTYIVSGQVNVEQYHSNRYNGRDVFTLVNTLHEISYHNFLNTSNDNLMPAL